MMYVCYVTTPYYNVTIASVISMASVFCRENQEPIGGGGCRPTDQTSVGERHLLQGQLGEEVQREQHQRCPVQIKQGSVYPNGLTYRTNSRQDLRSGFSFIFL